MVTESVGWCEAVDDYSDVDDYSHEESIELFNPDDSQ
ncbi:hypothetical protein BFJ63_vAg13265 [Fusarium oxysporum f. sp. narcissi]|uniref:Uncharacterized protein n=2 Tax=Fusarium oxysporum TaxID=5507 RepID=A0A4Q2VAZ6_FUSOX|nr:hypothetical protein BFJ65_g2290 [Fusarium oxysporum f. sp. cepae]RKK33918.1 hypothetical protein BFJ67_g14031 [Fusarium oxysporum f. sp. cepae]RKK35400.1 hypothetical protein BFJ66_g13978 [Fusarium oxysporum f. sp. cepae]RKL30483.1 hypothetical protein BFJ70_g10017 [Fusarium oxysporum]RYC83880.1 hypothetical protein BFJ63_vAg13265 [Fusarium oxysporum f. sp. narcissi]